MSPNQIIGIAVGLIGLGYFGYAMVPKERRKLRWGRRGDGAVFSRLSLIACGFVFTPLGAMFALKSVAWFQARPAILPMLVSVGIAWLIGCGFHDAWAKKKEPN
jgi:hypothetical protein